MLYIYDMCVCVCMCVYMCVCVLYVVGELGRLVLERFEFECVCVYYSAYAYPERQGSVDPDSMAQMRY